MLYKGCSQFLTRSAGKLRSLQCSLCLSICHGHFLVRYSLGMPDTTDFFADQGPEFAPPPDRLELVAGVVVATVGKPTVAQRRFNQLMAAIDAARTESEAMRRCVDAHRAPHHQAMHRLTNEALQLQKSMVMFLDTRLQARGLTVNQTRQITRILLSLCEELEPMQDPAIAAVLARHRSPEDVADREREDALAAQEAKELVEGYLGKDLGGQDFSSPEEVLRAAMEQLRAQEAARVAKRNAKREAKRDAKRQAKKTQTGPNAREQTFAQNQTDAQGALRTLYRQLASALHPDRAADAADRDRKTTLMKEVNAAYERKDLTALLRLQLTEAQVDTSRHAALSDDKLQAMCVLLTEQHKALQQDIYSQRMALAHEFAYAPHRMFTEAQLLAVLRDAQQDLQDEVNAMRQDLAEVQNDAAFKAWLKEQTRVAKALQREADRAMDIEMHIGGGIFGRMRRR